MSKIQKPVYLWYTINKFMLAFNIMSKYLKKKECILPLLKSYDYIFVFEIISIFNNGASKNKIVDTECLITTSEKFTT